MKLFLKQGGHRHRLCGQFQRPATPQTNSSRSMLDQGVVALLRNGEAESSHGNSLIETYQGAFPGTRIAQPEGLAIATAGLGPPKLSGLDVVERPACGIRPVSGAGRSQIATGGRGALEGQSQRRFDDAQSVNVRSRPALRGDHSCCGPRHCGYASGASRFFPFLTTQNAHSSKQSS